MQFPAMKNDFDLYRLLKFCFKTSIVQQQQQQQQEWNDSNKSINLISNDIYFYFPVCKQLYDTAKLRIISIYLIQYTKHIEIV